jgi:hypothetical protein
MASTRVKHPASHEGPMECGSAALGVEREVAPATPATIDDRPMTDRAPVHSEELKLQELSSRISAARSIY